LGDFGGVLDKYDGFGDTSSPSVPLFLASSLTIGIGCVSSGGLTARSPDDANEGPKTFSMTSVALVVDGNLGGDNGTGLVLYEIGRVGLRGDAGIAAFVSRLVCTAGRFPRRYGRGTSACAVTRDQSVRMTLVIDTLIWHTTATTSHSANDSFEDILSFRFLADSQLGCAPPKPSFNGSDGS
jgi:hypothetical protein